MTDPTEPVGFWRTPTSRRFDECFCWVAEAPDGSEGLVGGNIGPGGQWLALVGGDVDRMRSLRPIAEMTRRGTGYPVRLVRFTRREDLEELP